ncbi:aminoglycoside phosphotransferase family protein [Galenea microaerophila]
MEEDIRFTQLKSWLDTLPQFQGVAGIQITPASSDASFRRYFRLQNGETRYIVMDAPPEKEDCRPFIQVDQQLQQLGIRVPEIFAQDLTQGFLLLEDFGQETLSDRLKRVSETEVDHFYRQALSILVDLQTEVSLPQKQTVLQSLPPYSESLLHQEMQLFTDWLLHKHLNLSLSSLEKQAWQQLETLLIANAHQQPQTYVLRDYHSRNLMVLPEQTQLGVIDFQDAVQGPLTYDAISLLRDCYQRWPEEQVKEWQRYYFLALAQAGSLGLSQADWSAFQQSMDLMGIQRHLKAAGIFARLYHRDGKAGYLQDIPNTLRYLYEVGQQYGALTPLVQLLENKVLPAMEFDL